MVLALISPLGVGCGGQVEPSKTEARPPAVAGEPSPVHEKVMADIRSLPALIEAKKTPDIVTATERMEKAADDLLATLKDDEQPKPSEPGGAETYQAKGERDKEKAKDPKEMTTREACKEFKQITRDIRDAANKGEYGRVMSMKDRVEKLADRCFSPSDDRNRGKQ